MPRVTRISQEQLNKFISPEAAMAPYQRAQRDKEQQSSQDAELRKLILGAETEEGMKNRAYNRDLQTAKDLRGEFGSDVNIDAGQVRIGAKDPLQQLLRRRELEKPVRTEGQIAADKAFGQEYADYVAGGGNIQAQKNIGLLEDVQSKLRAQGDKAPGFFQKAAQFLPDPVRAAVTPEIKAQEDQVRTAVQSTLKQTLGAQFTQKEGDDLMRRSYDPRLSAAQNLAKMEPEIRALKEQLQRKMGSAQQFEKTGSLVGLGAAGGQPPSRQAVRKQYSPSRNQTKITYSDGSEEIVNGQQ